MKPKGRPKGSTRGRTTTTRSISLPPEVWAAIDAARGSTPRGKYILQHLPI